jgi:hypothetical protein
VRTVFGSALEAPVRVAAHSQHKGQDYVGRTQQAATSALLVVQQMAVCVQSRSRHRELKGVVGATVAVPC